MFTIVQFLDVFGPDWHINGGLPVHLFSLTEMKINLIGRTLNQKGDEGEVEQHHVSSPTCFLPPEKTFFISYRRALR